MVLVHFVSLPYYIQEYGNILFITTCWTSCLDFPSLLVPSPMQPIPSVFSSLVQHTKSIIGEKSQNHSKEVYTELYYQHYLGRLSNTPMNILFIFYCEPHNELL